MQVEYLALIIYLSFSVTLTGQIGGVSASKINAINHLPIPIGTAEFEPNYSITSTNSFWDDQGNKLNIFNSKDSILIETSLSFRMAYAVSEVFEVGSFIADDFSNWSIKYTLNPDSIFGYGVMLGLNLPYGNALIDKSNRASDQIMSYVFGGMASLRINEQSSIDFNLSIQKYINSNTSVPKNEFFAYVDYGYYMGNSGVLWMASLGYYRNDFDNDAQNVLTFYPGIGFEMKENYFMVINGWIDFMGKNIEQTKNITVAWTLIL